MDYRRALGHHADRLRLLGTLSLASAFPRRTEPAACARSASRSTGNGCQLRLCRRVLPPGRRQTGPSWRSWPQWHGPAGARPAVGRSYRTSGPEGKRCYFAQVKRPANANRRGFRAALADNVMRHGKPGPDRRSWQAPGAVSRKAAGTWSRRTRTRRSGGVGAGRTMLPPTRLAIKSLILRRTCLQGLE